jgi:hypothetical protein
MLQRLHTLRPEPRGCGRRLDHDTNQRSTGKTPVKLVTAWCKEHLPVSVQAQRGLAFSSQMPSTNLT